MSDMSERRIEMGSVVTPRPPFKGAHSFEDFSSIQYPDLNVTGDVEELMSSVALLYTELLEIDNKLNNKNNDIPAMTKNFKSKLPKIGLRNLNSLLSKLDVLVRRKRKELNEKIEKEENEAYHELLTEFLPASIIGDDFVLENGEELSLTEPFEYAHLVRR